MRSPKAAWDQWQPGQSPTAIRSRGINRENASDAVSAATPLSLDARIATANIENPADAVAALHILADVTGEDAQRTLQLAQSRALENERRMEEYANHLDYAPVKNGILNLQTTVDLLGQ